MSAAEHPGAWVEVVGEGAEADPSPERWAQLCARLRAAGEGPLASLPWREALRGVDVALRRLEDPADPLRAQMEARAAARHGALPTWRWGVETTLGAWTAEALEGALAAATGGCDALDAFVPVPGGRASRTARRTARRALGPRLLLHVQAGNLGAPGLEGMVCAALCKAPILARLPQGDDGLARAFAAALIEAEPRFKGAVALARWAAGDAVVEGAVLPEADVLLVHGSDGTALSLRARIPVTTRLVAHPHRLSIAWLGLGIPEEGGAAEALARGLALDTFAYEQLGCLSPRILFVEGDGARARAWARRLAHAGEALSQALPPGDLPDDLRAAAMQARGRIAFTGAILSTRGFTVAVDEGPLFPSPPGRFLLLRPAPSLDAALAELGPLARRVQGASLACAPDAWDALSERLARSGVAWIAPPGGLQCPPAGWPADGRPLLADLLSFSERTVNHLA